MDTQTVRNLSGRMAMQMYCYACPMCCLLVRFERRKRDATDGAQRRLVLGFGVDRSWSGRGGQARTVNTERQAQWTRINYGPLARVACQARRVPFGKREMEWSHVTQEPSSAELQARVKMRGRRGKVSRGLSEDPAVRPATQRHCR